MQPLKSVGEKLKKYSPTCIITESVLNFEQQSLLPWLTLSPAVTCNFFPGRAFSPIPYSKLGTIQVVQDHILAPSRLNQV